MTAKLIGALLATMVLALVVRLAREGAHHLDEAEAAAQRRDEGEARRGYERALRAYLPLAPHVSRAVAGLEALADDAHRDGRAEDERAALSALRAGLFAARSFYLPHRDHAARASQRLALLTGTDASIWWPPAGPRLGWVTLGLAGVGVMLFAVLRLAPRTFSPQLRTRTGAAVAMALTFTVGLLLFMVGMRLA